MWLESVFEPVMLTIGYIIKLLFHCIFYIQYVCINFDFFIVWTGKILSSRHQNVHDSILLTGSTAENINLRRIVKNKFRYM